MNLFYKKYSAEKRGIPIFLLHGILGSHTNWAKIATALSKHSDVYTLDLRNHGNSPHSNTMTYADMATDIKMIMYQEKIQKINIVGHSMGGKIAMQFALQFPQDVNKTVVIDIAPKVYPKEHNRFFKALCIIEENRPTSRKMASQMIQELITERKERLFVLSNLIKKEGVLVWRINCKAIRENYEVISAGIESNNTCLSPILFILSEKSSFVVKEDVQMIEELFEKSTFISVPNSSHWVFSDQPEKVIKILESFFN